MEFKEEQFKNVSREAQDLIRQLLKKDSQERPSALEALDHEWFKKKSQRRSLRKETIKENINRLSVKQGGIGDRQKTVLLSSHNLQGESQKVSPLSDVHKLSCDETL